jgi:release factor glutamine methyltransferase
MTIENWLQSAQKQLEAAGVATARLDTLVLLEDCLGRDRALLLAHPDTELTGEQISTLGEQLARRATHEPLAYIRGRTEFYGRQFTVDNRVLEPRPETETMIDLLKQTADSRGIGRIIDIGTGSGAIIITAALELENTSYDFEGVDIDQGCLEVARRNAASLAADVAFRSSNLLEAYLQSDLPIFALLCNLPYVPDNFQINTAAGHEPHIAIFGGPDGLDLYRTLFAQSQQLGSKKPRYILTEALPPQHYTLADVARSHGYRLGTTDGFIQRFVS